MRLKHVKTLQSAQDGEAKVMALAWSPNNKKLAVCTFDRVVLLFDEHGEKRDKFATKPVDAKYGKKSYIVKGMGFSPDSTKLAIGQTDCILFVYKLGDDWNEKKSICNKFVQSSPITCLIWLPDNVIVYGLADGKVKSANIKANKSNTVYNSESFVLTVVSNPSGKGILSGHADGSIIRYFFDNEGSSDAVGKICVHPSPPYALAWGNGSFIAAGCDKRVFCYGRDGRVIQQFYGLPVAQDRSESEFVSAASGPSGQSIVLGSYSRLRLFNFITRKQQWEEGTVKEIENLYTVVALAWKRDGSRIACGTLCGAVELFECSLKKAIYKNKFEITYVGPAQVLVKQIAGGQRVSIKSHYGYEIEDVKILGKDRYVVAHTSSTLILGDMRTSKMSEVQWPPSGGQEKFYFENENCCMIFSSGELTFVEYGATEILASVRTEFIKPQLFSVRVNERYRGSGEQIKKLAYLIDMYTVAIQDLISGFTVGQLNHDAKIDWLQLNETGEKLLFRDVKMRLTLFDIDAQHTVPVLSYCSFVQWVPGSDVVVAQSRSEMCIWYSIDNPDRVTTVSIRGDIVGIERIDNVTNVVINEGVQQVYHKLDEGRIEFGTAIDDQDYFRAVNYLESLSPPSAETEAMWHTLSNIAIETQNWVIASRCYAALGNYTKAAFLQDTIDLADKIKQTTGTDGFSNFQVQARFAILDRNLKLAESYYLSQNQLDEAIKMYQDLHRWPEAMELAEAKNHPQLEALRSKFFQYLTETRQNELAGEYKERSGDYQAALRLYLESGHASMAARLICSSQELVSNSKLVNEVAMVLIKGGFLERAGDLLEAGREDKKAMECFRRAKNFRKAVDLARVSFPDEVVKLEEAWGDHLIQQRQLDSAINHFIEAGRTKKAVEAAIEARQWSKAENILESLDPNISTDYYRQIAQHYASVSDFARAEALFVQAKCQRDAVEMYNNANRWEDAYRVASSCMRSEDVHKLYVEQARQLERQGKFKDAERLFTTVKEPDLAIAMYKKKKMFSDMLRLVRLHHPDLLQETHLHLAKELEEEGNLRQAEYNYVQAKDVKSCVNMYRSRNMWEEAYRVAKSEGGPMAGKQVAYFWAKSVGGDAAVKILSKFNLLEYAIETAIEQCAFEFAFELAKTAMQSKMVDIHLKYALYLEDEGKFAEAEHNFIKANKPKEAVLMYVHQYDWDSAQRVAEAHDPDSVSDVLVGQARHAFEQGDFTKAESFLLRAQHPELAVRLYKEKKMWEDAIRVCKEYLPNKLVELQDEYEQAMADASGNRLETLLKQARNWEQDGHYSKAVECLVRVTQEITQNMQVLEKCWIKAGELAIKYLMRDNRGQAIGTIKTVAARLTNIKKHNQAAEFYCGVEMYKEAVDVLIEVDEWNKAKKIAKEFEPKLEEYVDERYKAHLKSSGKARELANYDVIGALDMMAKNGQWDDCLEKASQQSDPQILNKYVALYATRLIKENQSDRAMELYAKYGAPAVQQNFNIYKRICEDMFNNPEILTLKADSFNKWSELRNMLQSLYENLGRANVPAEQKRYFERMFYAAHYCAMRAACIRLKSLEPIAMKLSIALLRYIDCVPADRAFYEAGEMCRLCKREDVAIVLLNRYLDIVDAIEDGNFDSLDSSDFEDTDIPDEFPLPAKQYLSAAKHDELKDWILTISMSRDVDQSLPTDERGKFEGALLGASACLVSGYPILKNKMAFKKNGFANRDDWSKLTMAARQNQSNLPLQDVVKFFEKTYGGA